MSNGPSWEVKDKPCNEQSRCHRTFIRTGWTTYEDRPQQVIGSVATIDPIAGLRAGKAHGPAPMKARDTLQSL